MARWRARADIADRSTRPHRLATPITAWEEALILELSAASTCPSTTSLRRCALPQPPNLPRSGVHRWLERHDLSARLTPPQALAVAFQTDIPAGFIHIAVKYLPSLDRRRR